MRATAEAEASAVSFAASSVQAVRRVGRRWQLLGERASLAARAIWRKRCSSILSRRCIPPVFYVYLMSRAFFPTSPGDYSPRVQPTPLPPCHLGVAVVKRGPDSYCGTLGESLGGGTLEKSPDPTILFQFFSFHVERWAMNRLG